MLFTRAGKRRWQPWNQLDIGQSDPLQVLEMDHSEDAMLTKEQNDLLTQTGRGTLSGELIRRYWQPAAFSEELPPGGAPLHIRHLGEDLVLFRDDKGRPGLLEIHCSHRGADLSYGRLENGGLRCLYHGWLYDVHGNCLEQPAEPAGSEFHKTIRHPAYPCQEVAGIIFAYLGPGEPPLLPKYEALTAPDDHRFSLKIFQDCNYLQGNEGETDPAHQSFLHRYVGKKEEEDRWGSKTYQEIGGTETSKLALYGQDRSPLIEFEETDFGLRIFGVRKVGAGKRWVKLLNFVIPNLSIVPGEMGDDGGEIMWHVPIDDTHHWKYIIAFRKSKPIDKRELQRWVSTELTPDYRPVRNRQNRYLQDRREMETVWFSGMGGYFHVQDVWAGDSMGPVADRTKEHLGYSDKIIVAARLMLLRVLKNLEAGGEPPHVIRNPALNRFPHLVTRSAVITDSDDWKTFWQRDAGMEERRESENITGSNGQERRVSE